MASAIAGQNAELALGLAEFGGVGCDADVARHCQLAPASEGETVDRGDDGLGTGLESAEYILPCTCARFAEYGRLARQLGDVGAGDECASGAGEYHAANCIVDADLIDGVTQFGDRRVIQGVEFVGAVDGESRDAICDFKRQEFEGHLDVFVDRFADIVERSAVARRSNLCRKFPSCTTWT